MAFVVVGADPRSVSQREELRRHVLLDSDRLIIIAAAESAI